MARGVERTGGKYSASAMQANPGRCCKVPVIISANVGGSKVFGRSAQEQRGSGQREKKKIGVD